MAPSQFIRIDGATSGNPAMGQQGGQAGISVAGAGDVNGDGRPDLVIGAPFEDNNGRQDSGSAYVVFGQPGPATIDLSKLGAQGFRMDGATPGELAGRAVSGAGDVNGDRRPDLLVGAPGAFSGSQEGDRKARGIAYVVFGKSSATPIDLGRLGTGGFQITGRRFPFPDAFGVTVSGAGDVDRDGHADVIVGSAGNQGFEDRVTLPSAYVIYGKRSSQEVRINRLGRLGFRIGGLAGFDLAVSGAGDVNGDRRSDVIIGNAPAAMTKGVTYVVFGGRYRRTINLARHARWGFRIEGGNRFDYAGSSVAGAGDVTRDRRADLIVGGPALVEGQGRRGAAYVVFGKRSARTVNLLKRRARGLRPLGAGGLRITGAPQEVAGLQVAGVRDVNGDRRPDVALNASGSIYVVFGKRSTSEVRLADLADRGFKIDGTVYEPAAPEAFPTPGGFFAVAGAGDMNGDGRGEILVGAPHAAHNGRTDSGSAYVFFSP